jgi:hypothetical protein
MKPLRRSFLITAFVLAASVAAFAQTPADAKQFTKDGLTFNYPANWLFNDGSNADAQQFTLGRPNSEAQVRLFVFRTPVSTPERLVEAKKVLVDPYIAQTTKTFQQMGAKPESTPASTEIGALKSDGVRISASLDGEPGAAEIYWGVVGQRLVVLTFFGPDKALKQAAPAWDTIRTSIAVAEPVAPAQAKPVASPSPKQ